jgi:hypothetical protein
MQVVPVADKLPGAVGQRGSELVAEALRDEAETVRAALEILSRAPDVPLDPGDELPGGR